MSQSNSIDLTYRPTRILLVEEDPSGLEKLRLSLSRVRDARFEIEWAGELAAALQRMSEGGIDIVLLDLFLPDSEGLATFERCYAFAPDVPIIVLTDMDDDQAAMSTVQGGAQDYLVKDLVTEQLLARSIRYAIERHRLLSALRSLSLIDDLTGLYNRRGFSDLGDQHLKLARRSARSVTLVCLDLDHFKALNDTLGHHVGDHALIKTAEILRSTFRRSDIIARLGEDEFAVLALEASGEDAEMLVGRLREKVEHFNRKGREAYELSFSAGISKFEEGSRLRLEDLLSLADAAAYEEKKAKRKEVSP